MVFSFNDVEFFDLASLGLNFKNLLKFRFNIQQNQRHSIQLLLHVYPLCLQLQELTENRSSSSDRQRRKLHHNRPYYDDQHRHV